MKRLLVLVGLFLFFNVVSAWAISVEETTLDTTKTELKGACGATVENETSGISDVAVLHRWFDQQFIRLNKKYYGLGQNDYRVVPLGSYRTLRETTADRRVRWNIGAEYHLPLNTVNGTFAVFSQDFGDIELFAKLFYGGGMGNIVGLDSADNEVSGNYGVNGEMAIRTDSYLFTPLFGLSYVWIDPENGSDGQANYLYAGNRFYMTRQRAFSFDARVGTAFWRDMDDNQPPGWFISGGFTLHRDVNLTKVGKPLLAPVEVGLFGNLSLETISSKVLFPLRLYKGLSLAPFGLYGIETGANDYSAVYGFGAELRLFGDEIFMSPSLNPYIGFQQNWLHEFPGEGQGSSAYFGARLYLTDIVALDGNFGPVFWDEQTLADKDLKDWIGRIGITVSFGRIRESRDLRGSVMTTRGDWGSHDLNERNFVYLEPDDIGEYDGEVRLYGLEPPHDPPPPKKKREGDLTDLKFFTTGFDLGLSMQPFDRKFNLLEPKEKADEEVFIAVLFNRHNALTDRLNSDNTYFHFFDLSTCQYFGYRWDANHARQPDYRQYDNLGVIGDGHDQPYLGNFEEFVRPMQWLDEETLLEFIKGGAIEERLLKFLEEDRLGPDWKNAGAPTPEELAEFVRGNYRIGYVKYPLETLEKLKAYRMSCDLASAVMVGSDVDANDDGLWITAAEADWAEDNPWPENLDSGAVVMFDHDDDFYFSNHVRVEGLFSEDVVIDSFGECSSVIPNTAVLDTLVVPFMKANPSQTVSIFGYADGTVMTEECQQRYPNNDQEALSSDRGKAIKEYLEDQGIDSERITVVGEGVKMPGRRYEPSDRCVVLRFSL